MLRLYIIIVALIVLLIPHSVEAENLFSASQSIAKQPTNWTGSITLPKFNERGVLTGLRITMQSKTDWTLEVESLDVKEATVLSGINTYISVLRPNLSRLFTHSPSLERRDDFTAYDGSVDYGGTSENTHTFSSDDPETRDISLSDIDAILFTGIGLIDLPITATA
ncbi:MAG: choice-of-anchor E domain-containing protein [bacterium]|nr:choice-of-anchor E domain-containing protein [bacterium]